MRTVRRLYFYLVTLISLELVIWGTVSLAQTLINAPIGGTANILASGLSLILVGIPIFLLHGAVVQRDAHRDPEERANRPRAVFFYAVRLVTLIPVVQSLIALAVRLAAGLLQIPAASPMFGVDQTLVDHIIIIVVNAVAWIYFDRLLRQEEKIFPVASPLGEVRRLYRYLWMVYTLVLVVAGAIEILWYILNLPAISPVRSYINASLVNGLGLALVGTPLWARSWTGIQRSLAVPGESPSLLRRVILFLLTLIPAVIVVIAGVDFASGLLRMALGDWPTLAAFLSLHRPAIAALLTIGTVWAFFHQSLRLEWESEPEEQARLGLRRLYFTGLALLGNASTFIGAWLLLSFLVDFLVGTILFAAGLRSQLSGALGAVIIGSPLWLSTWRHLQLESQRKDKTGDYARHSVLRRSYFYLVIFLSVVGVMYNAGSVLYRLFNAALGNPIPNLGNTVAHSLVQLALTVVWLSYHLHALRQDGRLARQALAGQRADFAVVVLQADESPFYAELVSSLQALVPDIPVTFFKLSTGNPPAELAGAQALILPTALAAGPSPELAAWLQNFGGKKCLVPLKMDGWYLLSTPERPARELARETAQAVRHLSEGEPVRAAPPSNPWVIAGYVFGGLFALELLLVVFVLLMSFISR